MENPFTLLDQSINKRVAVTLVDGESVHGRLVSFDDKGNIALADAVRSSVEEASRFVALRVIRGDVVAHICPS